MIFWTTAREVAFEAITSFSRQSGASYESIGTTRNQTGETRTLTFSNTYRPSGTSTLTTTSSFSSSFLRNTRSKQTTTSSQITTTITRTSTATILSNIWTSSSSINSNSKSTINFFQTSISASRKNGSAITQLSSVSTTTTSGTTIGNVVDTIYSADTSEILWKINQNPQYTAPLTDNAESGNAFTVSGLLTVVDVVQTTATPITIQSSNSSFSTVASVARTTNILRTINLRPAYIGGSTAIISINATSSTLSTISFDVSSQPRIIHWGNTETIVRFFNGFSAATRTDLIASQSHQNRYGIPSKYTITTNINNTVNSFGYGNTEKTYQFVGGNSAIAGNASMSVISPRGIAFGNNIGLFLQGSGIQFSDFDEDGLVFTEEAFPTARDGRLTGLTVTNAAPSLNKVNGISTLTVSNNSFTYLSDTTGKRSEKTVSGSITVGGQSWIDIQRTRTGIVGGDLAESETGHIRIPAGLFKNQEGQTSWFKGEDTTYNGSKETTYWYPISYLTNVSTGQSVFATPRNTSTWPNS